MQNVVTQRLNMVENDFNAKCCSAGSWKLLPLAFVDTHKLATRMFSMSCSTKSVRFLRLNMIINFGSMAQ